MKAMTTTILSVAVSAVFVAALSLPGPAQTSSTDTQPQAGTSSSSDAQPPYYNGSTKPPGQDTHSNASSNRFSDQNQTDPYATARAGRPVKHHREDKRTKGEQINPSTSSGPINPSAGGAAGSMGAGSGAGAGAGVP